MENIFQHKDLILTIDSEQSFSKAARKLFISQPSLSLMVKNIEKEIGAPLFDRNYKPPRLTEIGHEYVRIANEMSKTEAAFEDYISSINRLDTGSLRIGANQSLSSIVIPQCISIFSKKYPNIRISLMDANGDLLEKELSSGNLDIVVNCRNINTNLFESTPIKPEYLLLAMNKNFSKDKGLEKYTLSYRDILAGKHLDESFTPCPLSNFSDVPFILMTEGNDLRTRTNIIFKELFFEPTVLFEIERLVTIFRMIDLGTGASIISDTVAKDFHASFSSSENVVFYKIDSHLAVRTISVSYKKNRYITKAMQAFIDTLSSMTSEF